MTGESARAAVRKYNQSIKGSAHRRAYQRRIHEEALAAYGDGTCACCGTTEDLSLDHINGDGAEQREAMYGNRRNGGYRFYLWLRRNGYPPGYQVLCRRCNHSKAKTDRCQLIHSSLNGVKRCSDPDHQGPNPLPLDEFHRGGASPDGRQTRCKECWRRTDPVRRPRKGRRRGEQNVTRAVLNEEIVLQCRERARNGESQAALAREFHVSAMTMSDAIRGRTWAWIEGNK